MEILEIRTGERCTNMCMIDCSIFHHIALTFAIHILITCIFYARRKEKKRRERERERERNEREVSLSLGTDTKIVEKNLLRATARQLKSRTIDPVTDYRSIL